MPDANLNFDPLLYVAIPLEEYKAIQATFAEDVLALREAADAIEGVEGVFQLYGPFDPEQSIITMAHDALSQAFEDGRRSGEHRILRHVFAQPKVSVVVNQDVPDGFDLWIARRRKRTFFAGVVTAIAVAFALLIPMVHPYFMN